MPFFPPWLAFMSSMNVCLNCTWSSYPSAKNKWQITLKSASVGTLHITCRGWEGYTVCVPCQPRACPYVPSSPVRQLCEIIPARLPQWKIQKLNSCLPSHSSLTLDVKSITVFCTHQVLNFCLHWGACCNGEIVPRTYCTGSAWAQFMCREHSRGKCQM